jgi:NHL repeat-containing protein
MRRLAAIWAALFLLLAPAAQGAFDDPLFVYVPEPKLGLPPPPPVPPPTGYFNGPCGLAVDSSGRFYVADYYHDAVDVFNPPTSPFIAPPAYLAQLDDIDPLDGPCGLALDAANNLYVNDYHRALAKFGPSPSFSAGPVFDTEQPTGVVVDPTSARVYVNERTYIGVYGLGGAPVLDGAEPLRIGEGSILDGYGLALSRFGATAGHLYVADAAGDEVEVYDPATSTSVPVATISGPPGEDFVSLRDSALAVDWQSGELYVAENTQPTHTESPRALVHVFDPDGSYEGHLKYMIADALPPGLAVDNSEQASQGRVYVTSGNTNQAGVYAYPPGAATEADPLPPTVPVSLAAIGAGAITSQVAGVECASSCEAELRAGRRLTLGATPEPGSAFLGWSGEECSGTGSCTVVAAEPLEVSARFAPLTGPPAPGEQGAPTATPSAIAQKGTLRIAVEGNLSPRSLPRTGTAPISVSVAGRITTTDQSLPPQLESLRIELNRHGRLDTAGLPTCTYDRIQPASSSRALAACRPALVGRGSFTANITLAGQEPYPTRGRLLLFNSTRGGKPVLYGHIYSARPFATSFVIVFAVQKLSGGTYGTALNAPLPKAMDAWGRLTGLEMTLARNYRHRGERHSYISSGCPAPKGFGLASFPLARASFAFAGQGALRSTVVDSCRVRG